MRTPSAKVRVARLAAQLAALGIESVTITRWVRRLPGSDAGAA